MRHEIDHASYGKSSVRTVTWTQDDNALVVRDLDIQILVRGDFLDSFRHGDNHSIVPSDSLRRHALAESAQQITVGPEVLLDRICRRILAANPAVTEVTASAQIRVWRRRNDHTFVLCPWREIAQARADRNNESEISSGIEDLTILMTTGSSFDGFYRDELTTQSPAFDRPLSGTLSARWTLSDGNLPQPGSSDTVRRALMDAVTDRPSAAVQQLLTDVGQVVLDALPELAGISLRFDSAPMTPAPADLPGLLGHPAYEIGTGPTGITQVALTRNG